MSFAEQINEPLRWAMAASLTYATVLVIMCPCKTPVGCKQGQFYAAVLLPVAATAFMNMKAAK